MIFNTVSIDSGSDAQVHAVRNEIDFKLGGMGDPLFILIRLESAAERRLSCTRDVVTDDRAYINAFINRNL